MFTFRLKHAFCLLLVVGVGLMWWMWANGTDETANRLLAIRDKTLDLTTANSIDDVSNWVDWRVNWIGKDNIYDLDGGWRDDADRIGRAYHARFWGDCELTVDILNDGRIQVEWIADWPAIEAKAREENWEFYRQVIVTVLAALAISWVMWPNGTRDRQKSRV